MTIARLAKLAALPFAALPILASAQSLKGNNIVVYPKMDAATYNDWISALAKNGAKAIRFEFFPLPFQDTAHRPDLHPSRFTPAQYENVWFNFDDRAGSGWTGINGMMTTFNDVILPILRKKGIKAVIDLHLAPGAYTKESAGGAYVASDISMTDPYQTIFIHTWDRLATAYRNENQVVALDLWNEPRTINATYLDMMAKVVKRIRTVGFKKLVVVECNENPATISSMKPIADSANNIAYSFHMYQPHDFTGFGMANPVFTPAVKATVDKFLGYVSSWQKANGRPRIWVGEFGVMNSVGAEGNKYLGYVLKQFEAFGWDSSYIGDHIDIATPNAVWDIDAAKLALLSAHWKK